MEWLTAYIWTKDPSSFGQSQKQAAGFVFEIGKILMAVYFGNLVNDG
jgi:hypothetical protein